MLRSSPVSKASDTSTSTFRVRDGRQRGRTDETGAAAGTGIVVSFVIRLGSMASLRAQLQGAHVHGHIHVVPRGRRAEWKRSGTDRAGWQRAVGPVLHTVTLAAASRFHHRQGRADSVYRRETTNERTNRATGTRTRIRRGRAGGLERAEVAGKIELSRYRVTILVERERG